MKKAEKVGKIQFAVWIGSVVLAMAISGCSGSPKSDIKASETATSMGPSEASAESSQSGTEENGGRQAAETLPWREAAGKYLAQYWEAVEGTSKYKLLYVDPNGVPSILKVTTPAPELSERTLIYADSMTIAV